jgi:hypothetical protein
MKSPKLEIRNPRQRQSPDSGKRPDERASVLECGGSPPLSYDGHRQPARCDGSKSARGLAHSQTRLLFVAICFLVPAFCFSAAAQYAIPWHTMDGGGGTSTGGVYRVTGTIGQSDAGGPLTNGQFSVTGGFWVLPTAVQTLGAPTLTITPASPGFATISWLPATGTNWILQERLSLTAGAWTNSPSAWTNPITVPTTLPTKFYRLFKP